MSHTYEKALHLGLGAILASVMIASGAVSCGGGSDGDESAGGSTANSGGSSSGGSSASDGGSSASDGGTTGNAGGTTGAGGTIGAGGTTGAGGSGGFVPLPDGVCANGLDDDGDGLIDGFDPECTGAADNDEGTFATGIPGDNRDPKWQDCFYDGNSGAGDDSCRYHTDCLYGTLPPDDPDCVLSATCIEFCAARTPNGCDCFGCCTVQTDDGSVDILTGSMCSLASIDDLDACPRCTKTDTCGNDCGPCELCLGRTIDDLPPECTPPEDDAGVPPPGYTCNPGQEVCGPDLPACPAGDYCLQGCCIIQIQ
jgi:hypothetical protein